MNKTICELYSKEERVVMLSEEKVNQKPEIEGQKIQLSKEKRQKDKQWSTKHYIEN